MIQIPKVFQQRILNLINDYELKIEKVYNENKESATFYYSKLEEIYKNIEAIYNDENMQPVTKGEKVVSLTALFEEYLEKYQTINTNIEILKEELTSEIDKIADMIHQSKPELNVKDIIEAVNKYIITNSK